MPRSSPTTLNVPPFEGAVQQLVLVNVAVFVALAVLGMVTPGLAGELARHLALQPWRAAHGEVWQFATYSFIETGLLAILFNMLTLWWVGALLETAYGRRWLLELYFASAMGGAVIASAILFAPGFRLSPLITAGGATAAVMGVLAAFAVRFGDQELQYIGIRAKYFIAILIAFDVLMLWRAGNLFGVLLDLCGVLSGYLYVRFAPRRGMAFGFSEQYYGLRNSYYRYKRRRAARKFEVYMGKQGRNVKFDSEGRYIDPDELKKDPNDKRWMN